MCAKEVSALSFTLFAQGLLWISFLLLGSAYLVVVMQPDKSGCSYVWLR